MAFFSNSSIDCRGCLRNCRTVISISLEYSLYNESLIKSDVHFGSVQFCFKQTRQSHLKWYHFSRFSFVDSLSFIMHWIGQGCKKNQGCIITGSQKVWIWLLLPARDWHKLLDYWTIIWHILTNKTEKLVHLAWWVESPCISNGYQWSSTIRSEHKNGW